MKRQQQTFLFYLDVVAMGDGGSHQTGEWRQVRVYFYCPIPSLILLQFFDGIQRLCQGDT